MGVDELLRIIDQSLRIGVGQCPEPVPTFTMKAANLPGTVFVTVKMPNGLEHEFIVRAVKTYPIGDPEAADRDLASIAALKGQTA